MKSVDLFIPIYLNQQIVFDLIAMLEDGFSQLSTIKTSATETESQKSGTNVSIGVSQVLALFGISLTGERGKEKGAQEQTEVSQEKVHTPTSLFAKLRLILNERQLLKRINTQEEIKKLASGQFVEFRAVLKKNPLVDALEGIKQLKEIAVMFTDNESGALKVRKRGEGERPQDDNQLIMQQLDGMLTALTQPNSLELIGEMLDIPGVKAVLSAKLDYFSDRNAQEIIDGEFRVFGKIIRVIGSSRDTIKLLRKTSFGQFDRRIFDLLASGFEGLEIAFESFPELITEIKGPVLQIIPIAIFT